MEGIDYVNGAKEMTLKMLNTFGIKDATIYEDNFLDWTPNKLYNLVCSFGFIEHFLMLKAW